MRIFLLLIATIAIYSTAFINTKCDHVFTQVEQPTIKIEQPELMGGQFYRPYSWPTGLQEGMELICVKCFHKQKQILDYGQPAKNTLTDLFMSGKYCDTISIFNSGNGALFLKSGVLQVDTIGMFKISTHAY